MTLRINVGESKQLHMTLKDIGISHWQSPPFLTTRPWPEGLSPMTGSIVNNFKHDKMPGAANCNFSGYHNILSVNLYV